MRRLLLQGALLVSGLVVMAVGVNVGLGGIRTLGMQVAPDFIAVADAAGFAVQDSHTRFLGGLFSVVGAILVAGAFAPHRLRNVLIALCAIMPVAGLFRLGGADTGSALTSLLPSLAFEFVVFPTLAVALWRLPAPQQAEL